MIFHDATCGRARSLSRRIADALQLDCPCCTIWRVGLYGVAAGILAASCGPWGVGALLALIAGVVAVDVVRAAPAAPHED